MKETFYQRGYTDGKNLFDIIRLGKCKLKAQ